MNLQFFIGLVLLHSTVGVPYLVERNSRLYRALERTARDVGSFGKASIRYYLPGGIKLGIRGLRPLRKRRQLTKRQVMFNPLATSYYQNRYPSLYVAPYNTNPMYQRSNIFTPQNTAPVQPSPYYQNAFMNMYNTNPWFNQARRAFIPTIAQTETKKDQVDPVEKKATLESLKNFRRIVAEVKDAIVSIDSDGKVALNENFDSNAKAGLKTNIVAQRKSRVNRKGKGVFAQGKKRGEIKKKDQESKKNKIKEQIAKYFTDFVCGDYC